MLERERRKERKLEAGILLRSKGRPRKDAVPRNIVAEPAYEIRRLQMENKLLRDFLHFTGRARVNTTSYTVLRLACQEKKIPMTTPWREISSPSSKQSAFTGISLLLFLRPMR